MTLAAILDVEISNQFGRAVHDDIRVVAREDELAVLLGGMKLVCKVGDYLVIEIAFGLVAAYGLVIILLATYLSCLAVPVPTAFVMLAGGAFAASGDLALMDVLLAALTGALIGGFILGRLLRRRPQSGQRA